MDGHELYLFGKEILPIARNWISDPSRKPDLALDRVAGELQIESNLQLRVPQLLNTVEVPKVRSKGRLGQWVYSGTAYSNGYGGNDRIEGGKSDDRLFGGAGNDRLDGREGNDMLGGGSGTDLVSGDAGNDMLDGGTGKDQQSGGAGNDVLLDRDGGDRLFGNAGNDQFVIGTGKLGPTIISDFQVRSDKVKFQPLGLTYQQLQIRGNGSGTTLSVGGKALVQLANVKPSQLSLRNFEFGDSAIARRLKNLVQLAIEKALSPGAVLSVTTATGETWTGAAGVSNLSAGKATQPDDRFQIGSITKSFTATVILQLVQENKINLNDKLSKWLPQKTKDIILNANQITLRQMLNHTSGIPNYTDVPAYVDAILATPTKQWQPQEVLALIKGIEPINKPGEKFNYSNTNYYLLGLVIERATGSSYVHEIRTRILEPLGMENTFASAKELIPGGYAHAYNDINGNGKIDYKAGEDITKINISSFGAAGIIVSNAMDLSRFGQALLSGELLAPKTLKLMETSGTSEIIYGLGIFQSIVPGQEGWWGHNGGTFGYTSSLFSDPNSPATFVTLENSDTLDFGLKVGKGYKRALRGD